MKRILMFINFALMAASHTALGKMMIVPLSQETIVPVNSKVGTLLQFPASIKNITPSQFFKIKEENSDVDRSTGKKGDVKTLSILPTSSALSESVAVVFWNGKFIKLKFVATTEAEPFYDLQFEAQSKEASDPRFLKRHMALLKSMIKDESGGYRREVINNRTQKELGKVRLELVRVYNSQDISGFAYKVQNLSNEKIIVNPSAIVFSGGLKTVASQIDSQTLEPCPFLRTTPECTTTLRIVTQGANLGSGEALNLETQGTEEQRK